MTARATLTQSDLDRAVKAASKGGMAVTVTAPDGKTFTFTPLDAKPESDQPVTEFDRWQAKKREGRREGRA